MSAKGDAFAAARQNILETTKWLVGALAAIVAAALGGSTFSNLGSLDWGWRLTVAIAGGFGGLAFVLGGLFLALRLLVRKPFFLEQLLQDADRVSDIENHAKDLLPPEERVFTTFVKDRSDALDYINKHANDDPATNTALADNREFAQSVQPYVDRVVSYAHFETMRAAFDAQSRLIVLCTLCAVTCFGVFAWAANPEKAKATPAAVRVTCATPAATPPSQVPLKPSPH